MAVVANEEPAQITLSCSDSLLHHSSQDTPCESGTIASNSRQGSWYGQQVGPTKFPQLPRQRAVADKMFKCDVPNCKRKDGFLTLKDLERHKTSVHHIRPNHGEDDMFKCSVAGCPKASNVWKGLDSFLYHLNRVHKGCDVDEMVRR